MFNVTEKFFTSCNIGRVLGTIKAIELSEGKSDLRKTVREKKQMWSEKYRISVQILFLDRKNLPRRYFRKH